MPIPPARPRRLRNGPFTGSAALRAGLLTPDQLRSSAWQRLFRDVYVSATMPVTYRLRIAAAALILPPYAVISGRTAAHLWGVERCDVGDPIEVLTGKRFGPVTGLQIRVGPLADDERVTRGGIPVCDALHTTWELARSLPLLEAVAWIDGLARSRALTRNAVVVHARRHATDYGHGRADEAIALCDPRAESPPESHLRVHIVQAGLPTPTPQFVVVVDGQFLARVDLAWPQWKFAVEYDGQWHVDPDQLTRDRTRLRALNAAGWYVYHVTRDDMRNIGALMTDLGKVLAEKGR